MELIQRIQRMGVCRLFHNRVTPRTFMGFSALLLPPFFILYLLTSKPNSQLGQSRYRCPPKPMSNTPSVWSPALPPPAWSSPEEQAHLKDSMARWEFSVGICEGCQAYHYNRVLTPSASICAPTAEGNNPELLILISTIHQHREHRALIRETWGTHTHNNTGRVRILFLLGEDPVSKLHGQQVLQEEAATHGDILQDDFNSSSRRGSEVRLIMGYRWGRQHCSNVMHIVKVGDDVFVNIPKVLDVVTKVNLNNSIFGSLLHKTKPVRDKTQMWYASPESWPAATYPDYVEGVFIGVTQPVLRKLLLISPYMAWTAGADDVMIGMCAEKLGIPLKAVPGIQTKWDGTPPCKLGAVNALHFDREAPAVLQYLWNRRDCFEGGSVHLGPINETMKYNGTI